jgi:hypothetical protein
MTPTIGTALPGGSTQQNAPAASPSAAPTDFMMLLAQVVGPPAQQAITPMPLQAALPGDALQAPEGEETGSPDAAQVLPFALPFMAAEGVFSAQTPQKMIGIVEGQAGAAARAALDVKVMTDMIQAEQSGATEIAPEGDLFQLPLSGAEGSQQKLHAAGDPNLRAIHVPVGNAQWADELGARLTTMTEQGRHAASLRLSPEHLGPLEVRISIRDDQASVWFGAAHADTRAAIEHALPRLREMFEAQGMSLADAGVFHEAPREQAERAQGRVSLHGDAGSPEALAAASVRLSIGLVDAYA